MRFYSQVLGNWLEDSGWTSALVQVNIASTGTADSFIKASHVTKTQHAHQTKHTLSTHQKQLQQGQKFFHWKRGVKCVLRRVSSSVTGSKQCH